VELLLVVAGLDAHVVPVRLSAVEAWAGRGAGRDLGKGRQVLDQSTEELGKEV
jgi:hypothetical protein